ncbi:MAG: hypothetical protein ACH34U_11510 [Cyanobium sp.]
MPTESADGPGLCARCLSGRAADPGRSRRSARSGTTTRPQLISDQLQADLQDEADLKGLETKLQRRPQL